MGLDGAVNTESHVVYYRGWGINVVSKKLFNTVIIFKAIIVPPIQKKMLSWEDVCVTNSHVQGIVSGSK